MSRRYHPISCDFHDELCLLALRRRVCEIVYRSPDGRKTVTLDFIEDLYTQDKEEFLRLGNGEIIRLDRLLQVDGRSPPTETCDL